MPKPVEAVEVVSKEDVTNKLDDLSDYSLKRIAVLVDRIKAEEQEKIDAILSEVDLVTVYTSLNDEQKTMISLQIKKIDERVKRRATRELERGNG